MELLLNWLVASWNVMSALLFLKSHTRLNSHPPASTWRTHPTEAMTPKTAARMCPCEKDEMVLINPAEPVAYVSTRSNLVLGGI